MPNLYDRGSCLGASLPSEGKNLNFCKRQVTKRKMRFLARTSPGQTLLPAPNNRTLKENNMKIWLKFLCQILHFSRSCKFSRDQLGISYFLLFEQEVRVIMCVNFVDIGVILINFYLLLLGWSGSIKWPCLFRNRSGLNVQGSSQRLVSWLTSQTLQRTCIDRNME